MASCHKEPLSKFDKTLLSTKHIIEGFRSIYGKLNHIKNIILIGESGYAHRRLHHPQNDQYQKKLREILMSFDQISDTLDLSELKKEIKNKII